METILCDKEKFLMTGVLTPSLYWFKTKMMHAINNNSWDPFCKSPSGYYVKCVIVDEAMGLWILHFKDYINVAIKSEIMDVNESNAQGEEERKKATNSKKRKGECHIQRLRGHSSMSINMYTFYKKKLESLHAGDGVMPLVNLSDIIAHNVISNRNAQQIHRLTVDDEDSSDEDDEDNAKDANESIPDPTEYMDQNNWESV